MNRPRTHLRVALAGVVASLLLASLATPASAAPASPRLQLSASEYSRGEDGGAAVVTLKRSGNKSATSSTRFRTYDGTARASSDYLPVDTTVVFSPGQMYATVNVELVNDNVAEPPETVNLILGPEVQGAQLAATKTAVLTIEDDDEGGATTPAISVDDPSPVDEGQAVVFTITLSATSSQPASVEYATADGTASAGADYVSTVGSVTVPPGSTSATFPVPTLDDGAVEDAETFTVTLTNPANATIADGSGTATIAANDSVVDADSDGHAAGADCDDGDATIHPGAQDSPDLAFVDANCDAIDGDAATAVFVSGSGDDANPGTRGSPKRTVQAGVSAAAASPGADVLVSSGTFDEAAGVALATGVDIYGGYDPVSWARSSTTQTTLVGAPQAALADGDTGVVVQLVTLEGRPAAGSSMSVYGLRAVNGSSVSLDRVAITTGPAIGGASGASGAAGASGLGGGPGTSGSCDGPTPGNGGGGGFSSAGRAGGTGGRGGAEGANSGQAGGTGGGGTPGGLGGAGGDPGRAGGNGASGTFGSNGANGSGGSSTTSLAGADWVGAAGSSGVRGVDGNGGGGGGGGGGQGGTFVDDGSGNGGGGGGGGGAAGTGGGGGQAGGGSFGVYLSDSDVTLVSGSTVAAGDGGAGGAGPAGGNGGSGGLGGAGATTCISEVGAGGDGGRGGTGGRGGAGGGGAGGPSVGVFRAGSSTATVNDASITFGTGGAGGTSVGSPGSAGVAQAMV